MTNWNSIIRPGTNYFRPKFRVNNGKEFQCSFQDIHHSTLDSNTLQLYTNVLLISTVGADGKILLKYTVSGEKIQNVKYVCLWTVAFGSAVTRIGKIRFFINNRKFDTKDIESFDSFESFSDQVVRIYKF